MAHQHLNSTHCFYCGEPHGHGVYLITRLQNDANGWRIGRFCSYACLEGTVHELQRSGIDVPADLVGEPIVEANHDEAAYAHVMNGCADMMQTGDAPAPQPTHADQRRTHRWAPIYTLTPKTN